MLNIHPNQEDGIINKGFRRGQQRIWGNNHTHSWIMQPSKRATTSHKPGEIDQQALGLVFQPEGRINVERICNKHQQTQGYQGWGSRYHIQILRTKFGIWWMAWELSPTCISRDLRCWNGKTGHETFLAGVPQWWHIYQQVTQPVPEFPNLPIEQQTVHSSNMLIDGSPLMMKGRRAKTYICGGATRMMCGSKWSETWLQTTSWDITPAVSLWNTITPGPSHSQNFGWFLPLGSCHLCTAHQIHET